LLLCAAESVASKLDIAAVAGRLIPALGGDCLALKHAKTVERWV